MLSDDPLWYKDAIIYELHVRSFHDSVDDGIGDFQGLTRKLDYLEDLGITAIWLLPFYPSPLRDDGYDISDYTNVNPTYGTLEDFKQFLDEAHRRGIRVITELVINHTSDQHPWFQRARRAPRNSPERNFYVWSDTPDKYEGVPIMFPDYETSNWAWDPVAKQYYWHRFYSHQPDLNYDNPAVWDAIFPVVDFWFKLGVDGMRLDAVPYLYEREGTLCEHLPETHAFLKALRRHVDERFRNKMFLAEANAWPEDAVAYFGEGDECHMSFHFPLMPRLFMALQQEDRFPILDIFDQTPPIPDTAQWCLFLRNHDELTLAMVTDEERDYMYRAYAADRQAKIFLGIRHRLAPLLRNDRRRIELMNALVFSLPGTPVVYYGDEIGMGDNIYLGDRNGVRTPMQWSSDRNAGFSRANPQKLFLPVIIDPEYHYEAINVEAQQNNPSSLLWWMKRLIALRKQFQAFGRGTIEFLRPSNPKVLAFIRKYKDERLLVIANLSRFVQPVELDLSAYAGLTPQELFGKSHFPVISTSAYPLTLGPHSFYWFSLITTPIVVGSMSGEPSIEDLPTLRVHDRWQELTQGSRRDDLEKILPGYMARRRPGGLKPITTCRILDAWPMSLRDLEVDLLTVRVEFKEGLPETSLLPLTLVPEASEGTTLAVPGLPPLSLARISGPASGIMCNALAVPDYCQQLLTAIAQGRRFPVENGGEFRAVPLPGLSELLDPEPAETPPTIRLSQRNNLSVTFGNRLILKLLGRLEYAINPGLELGLYLTERGCTAMAPILGYIEFLHPGSDPATLAVVHKFIVNQGDAWSYTIDHLSGYFERVAALSRELPPPPPQPIPLGSLESEEPAHAVFEELVGSFLATARDLGRLTADLHRTLADAADQPDFTPVPFTRNYQRSIYQSMRNLTASVCSRLQRDREKLPEALRDLAGQIAAAHDELMNRFRVVLDRTVDAVRIRCHGDFHLGQLLYTGRDFVVIDFEGDPTKTVGERRIKRSPLRDVASMIRSFDYAVSAVLDWPGGPGRPPGVIRAEDRPFVQPWGMAWYNRVARAYLSEYLQTSHGLHLWPQDSETRQILLDLFLLERALHEVDYEISRRSDWAVIPMRAVLRLLRCPLGQPEGCF